MRKAQRTAVLLEKAEDFVREHEVALRQQLAGQPTDVIRYVGLSQTALELTVEGSAATMSIPISDIV
jgi:hypothetical protein